MKRSWILVGVCLCILAGAQLSQAAPQMTAEQRERFRAARTARVISEISHKEEAGDVKILARGAISPAAFTQPFEEVARATLEPSGLRVVSGGSGAAADLTFRVRASFEETLNSLTFQFSGNQATMGVGGLGAQWQGSLTVSAANVPDYVVSFAGQAQSSDRQSKEHLDRQSDQMEIVMHVSKGAVEALLAYGSYAFAVTEVMGQAYGREPLLASLDDTQRHRAFRAAAARTLGAVGGEGTLERLLEALKVGVPEVRAGAAEGLGRLGDERALQPLLEALRQPDETMQASAITALGTLGDPRAIEPLVEATLKNASDKVSMKAAEALGQLGGPSAADALLVSLQDKSASTRRRAVRALGKLNDPRAVESLAAAAKDEDVEVRRAAAQALGESKDPRRVEALLEALRDSDTDVRSAAATAVGKSGDARGVEPLMAALADGKDSVRSSAIKALGELGDRRAGPRLLPLLGAKDTSMRQLAAESLGRVGDASCVEPLIAALKDKEVGVRAATAGALGQLTGQRFGEDRKQWEKWWKQNKKTFSPTPWAPASTPAASRVQGASGEDTAAAAPQSMPVGQVWRAASPLHVAHSPDPPSNLNPKVRNQPGRHFWQISFDLENASLREEHLRCPDDRILLRTHQGQVIPLLDVLWQGERQVQMEVGRGQVTTVLSFPPRDRGGVTLVFAVLARTDPQSLELAFHDWGAIPLASLAQ